MTRLSQRPQDSPPTQRRRIDHNESVQESETGALMASVTFSKVLLWNRNTDTATVLSSQTSNASGQLSITGLIAGNDYAVIPADDVATVVSDTKSSVRHYRAA